MSSHFAPANAFPPGLKPNFGSSRNGAAEAAPLQAFSSNRLGLQWNALTPVALALAAAALLVPYLLSRGFLPIAFILQRGFALVCHQRPERSFFISGVPVAVCARCLGMYVGAAVGLLVRMSEGLATRLFVAAVTLNLIDAVAEYAGWHGNWMAVRFALGLMLGATGALLISSAMPNVSPAEPGSP